jgi:site-specific recombinase XerD
MAEISPLRRRMIEDMTVRNLSPATQQSYLHAVSKFSRYFGHSPDRLGLEDVRAFQVHLASTGISWGSLNRTVCVLRFFYGVTLGQDAIPERIAYAREPRKLPPALSGDEVIRFLEAVSSLKARVALTTAYAAGLRVSEVTSLDASDPRHVEPSGSAIAGGDAARIGAGWNGLRWSLPTSSAVTATPMFATTPRILDAASVASSAP